MRLNLQLIKLHIQHKLGKKHIILDVLSRLANKYICSTNTFYLKLDTLFVYNTTLVIDLISKIIIGYNADAWLSRL